MTEDIRYGIIGCSGMGGLHARALADVERARLVACSDIDEETAREFGDEHDCLAFSDHVEMIADADLDVASVCTPNGTHAEIVVDLAEAGVHVLCEKPLDVTLPRVDRMIEACDDAGMTFGCVFQRRTFFGPQLQRKALADGRLGELTLADVSVKWHREPSYYDVGWRGTADLDGGVLLTQALHGIDLLQWIVGDVERVCAQVKTLHHDIEVPDTAVLSLEFGSGALGQVTATTAMYPQYPITLNVHGTEGTVRWHQNEVDEFVTTEGDVDYADESVPYEGEHAGQIRDFVEAVREGREPMVTGREGRKAVAIVAAATASAREGRWVDLDEFGEPGDTDK